MALDPQIATVIEQIRSLDQPRPENQPLDEARAAYRALASMSPRPDSVEVDEFDIPGPGGSLTARVYRPSHPAGSGFVYFHGGGWTIGDLETHDGACGALAEASRSVAVAVDYRLAPEHPYPAAVEDADAATRWVAEHAGELSIDPEVLGVAGDSAGGNLATVVARRFRDGDGPTLAGQLLIYPGVDGTSEHPSFGEHDDIPFLPASTMRWFFDTYCGHADAAEPDISPLGADLAGLPPAVVVTAEFDPLRDQVDAYAKALADAGVEVTHLRYDDLTHVFVQLTGLSERAAEATEEIGREFGTILNASA